MTLDTDLSRVLEHLVNEFGVPENGFEDHLGLINNPENLVGEQTSVIQRVIVTKIGPGATILDE